MHVLHGGCLEILIRGGEAHQHMAVGEERD